MKHLNFSMCTKRNDIVSVTEYRSPDYECLGFDLIKKQLVEIGYPEELAEYNYDDRFAIR